MNQKISKGQSLMEIVISLVVIVLILSGLAKVLLYSLKNMEFSRSYNLSLSLAQDKAEEIRMERDSTDWNVFWEKYFPTDPNILVETELGEKKIFTRTTTINDISQPENAMNKMEAVIVVSWTDSKGEHESSIGSILSKWR